MKVTTRTDQAHFLARVKRALRSNWRSS